MKHRDWEDKPKTVDALTAEVAASYLESKEVNAIQLAIQEAVKTHGYLSTVRLARLVECPRKWSLLDIAETVPDVLRIKGYYVYYDQEATIEKLERKQYTPSEQDQFGRRCVYRGRMV